MQINFSLLLQSITGGTIAFLATIAMLPWLIRHSPQMGALDIPNGRKLHTRSVPRVGGIAMLLSFLPVDIWYLVSGALRLEWSTQLLCVVAGTVIVLFTGLIDDTKGLSAKEKFLLQLTAAIVVVLGGVTFSSVDLGWLGSYSFRSLEALVTILYIVGITNAINLIDGLDGLAGGVALIITTAFLGLSVLSNDGIGLILVLSALIGGLSGFLIYNRWPAKVFLGDTGSLFLGWSFAILSLIYAQKSSVTLSIAIPVMVLGLPAFDVIFVMTKRMINNHRKGLLNGWLSMFKPDKNHLHHLLLSCGLSRNRVVWVLYGITILTSLVAFSSWVAKNQETLLYSLSAVFVFILIVRLIFEVRLQRKTRQASQVTIVEPKTTPVRVVHIAESKLETH
ncbi:undecaprenyl/decaprenyl-phosphate alpha-N-acetylglucosaminyl 1-phosphate transferase [bacterium]|nr:undecaprenyl/decaprenyl-phosphate alpha-N-acetylglucosaminyl 1-phosphate transferase [bacterium]